MDAGRLTEEEILKSKETLSDEFQISFGHAQKTINDILKSHFFLNKASIGGIGCAFFRVLL